MPKVTVRWKQKQFVLEAEKGQNLRKLLLQNGISPYSEITRSFNCGGRGICATCGVYLIQGVFEPTHWHDKLAKTHHYPRLSCKITIEEDLEIVIPDDKILWGKPIPEKAAKD